MQFGTIGLRYQLRGCHQTDVTGFAICPRDSIAVDPSEPYSTTTIATGDLMPLFVAAVNTLKFPFH